MNSLPKNHRLRFSVRTLLLAIAWTCVAMLWLSGQWRMVNERQTVRRIVNEAGGTSSTAPNPFFRADVANVTFVRRLIGDSEVTYFFKLGNLSPVERDRVKRAFPEAETNGLGPWKIGRIVPARSLVGVK